jgi:hypothetical protein
MTSPTLFLLPFIHPPRKSVSLTALSTRDSDTLSRDALSLGPTALLHVNNVFHLRHTRALA